MILAGREPLDHRAERQCEGEIHRGALESLDVQLEACFQYQVYSNDSNLPSFGGSIPIVSMIVLFQ